MAVTAVGKFDIQPAIRYVDRWDVRVLEPMAFNDLVHGELVVPAGFESDMASIRGLREACRWSAILALVCWLLAWSWIAVAGLVVAVLALALYGLLAGYGMRAAVLHDWLYTACSLSRSEADAVLYRALCTGDGTARWRSGIFWIGVRVGGAAHFGPEPKA